MKEKFINIKVIPKAKKQKIVQKENRLKVYLKSPPEDGKANEELIKVLSEYFKTSKGSIQIIKGKFSRNKTIKINFE